MLEQENRDNIKSQNFAHIRVSLRAISSYKAYRELNSKEINIAIK